METAVSMKINVRSQLQLISFGSKENSIFLINGING